MTATLIGGTGLTGSFLLRRLFADPAVTSVISVARNPSDLSSAKLTEVPLSDLAQLPSFASRMRADLYFCCLGTTRKAAGSRENFEKVDHDAVVAFAKIAQAHKAQSFTLVSSMGAHPQSRLFYTRVKGRTENDVEALGLRSLIIFRPALLVGPRRQVRFAETLATKPLVWLAHLLHSRLRKRLITEVDPLALRMLDEAKAARPGVHIIKAKDI